MEDTILRRLYRRHPSLPTLTPQTSTLTPSLIPPTSLLVRVHSVSLNYRDINILRGTNPWPVLSGGIPCSDAVGSVVFAGSGVSRWKVGDRVMLIVDQVSLTGSEQERAWLGGEVEGVLASHLVVGEEKVVGVPRGLGWSEASALPCAGVTAWSALVGGGEERGLVMGTVLVQGTGGVSLMAAKLAAAAGCKVIVTSSSDDKLRRVKQIEGLADVLSINYRTNTEWHEEALRLNGGRGVDVIIENGGTSSLLQSCAAIAKRGVISQVGYLGKQDPNDLKDLLPVLIEKAINLRGIAVGSRKDFEDMNDFIEEHGLRFESLIDKEFLFDEAPEAFEYLKSQEHIGKVAIQVD